MKLALSNIAWEPDEELDVVKLMLENGVSGIEIAPTKIWSDPTAVMEEASIPVRDMWDSRGVPVSSLQALLFGHPEFALFGTDSDRETMLEYVAKICRLGGWLGAGPLVFGSPKNRLRGQLSENEAIAISVPFFRHCGEEAAKAGAVFCLEPNPPEYGADFMTNTAETLRVVERVDHPAVRLHLDSGIMTLNGEDPTEWIRVASPMLRHFHVSEPHLAVIGSGGVDHDRFASALRDSGYSGWASVEMRSGWSKPNTAAVEQALVHAGKAYGGD